MWIKSIIFQTTNKFGILYTPIDLKDKHFNGPRNVIVPHLHGLETTIFWCKILHKWKNKIEKWIFHHMHVPFCGGRGGRGIATFFWKKWLFWLHFQFIYFLVLFFVSIFEMFRYVPRTCHLMWDPSWSAWN